jgi:phage tail-like protein
MAMTNVDPLVAFRYAVEIDQLVVGGFSDVSGLAFELDVETVREGGNNGAPRQLPGAMKDAGRITLRHGMADRSVLWDWFVEASGGCLKRRKLSVLLLDSQHGEVRRWNVVRACPVKWQGPSLRAQAQEVAFEAIEFVHEGLAP